MDSCKAEELAGVQELPGQAQKIWTQAFREALLQVHGDERKAAAMAWKAFKGETARTREGRGGTKGEKAIVTMAVRGGTPEWIKPMNYGEIVLADGRCTCLVDRKALEAIISHWQRQGSELVVRLVRDQTSPDIGWIKELEGRVDGLWIKVEWTEEGLVFITRKKFGYLVLEFILDESSRPVQVWKARLTDFASMYQWDETIKAQSSQQEDQLESGRRLRLIKGASWLEMGSRRDSRWDLYPGAGNTEGPQLTCNKSEVNGTDEFLAEMKDLLQLHGEVSLARVKKAVRELKLNREEICGRLKDELEALKVKLKREVIGKAVEEALETGKITPGQRGWAEAYAQKDWQGFKDFLDQGSRVLPGKQRMKLGIFPFRSMFRSK